MKTLHVDVTADDLRGNPNNYTDCPVYRAMHRVEPRVNSVGIRGFVIDDKYERLPTEVGDTIAGWVNYNRPRNPFSFTVEVPD